jgi:hypothetical protein
VKSVWAVVLSVTAIGLTACGSSDHSALSQHLYSVRQVESAFASHGITLHQRQESRGTVTLVARGVKVLVNVASPGFAIGWTGEKPIFHRNLVVVRAPADTNAVKSALQEMP